MSKTEEEKLLLEAWDKIRHWVRTNCSFSGTEEFTIESTPFHWCKLEIFPSGECAASSGSWGNPGEHRPNLLYGHDSYHFSTADNAPSWNGEEGRLESYRKRDLGVDYRKGSSRAHWRRKLPLQESELLEHPESLTYRKVTIGRIGQSAAELAVERHPAARRFRDHPARE